MKYSFKYIIFTILTCLVYATSCTSDPDPDVLNSEQGEEISFEVGNSTRAAITTNETLKNFPFMLFGDINRTGEFYAGLKTIFNTQKVELKNNRWDYGAKQYWLMGQEHSFVAIHPYDVLPDLDNLKYENSMVSFTYELPDALDNAKDILVAAHRRKYNMNNGNAVKFNFTHLLSTINIMPALDEVLMYEDEDDKTNYPYNKDEYILFQKIELIGVRTRADFSFTPESLGTGNSTDNLAVKFQLGNEGAKDQTFDFKDNPKKITNNKENVSIFDNNKAVIILPQSFGEDSSSEIRLYYSVNDDHDVLRKITIPLKGKTWKMGTNYTYKFTIEKAYTGQIKARSFTIDVDDPQHEDDEHDDAWVWNGETIDFIFDQEEY
ncbi:MAG: fimbrillin family protein [Muribaculaceae bacterium]|nr:fimbrillin family protein [Muribaculaceae bacterium]